MSYLSSIGIVDIETIFTLQLFLLYSGITLIICLIAYFYKIIFPVSISFRNISCRYVTGRGNILCFGAQQKGVLHIGGYKILRIGKYSGSNSVTQWAKLRKIYVYNSVVV